jgi:holo-[acyl-carrier protein] synthase
LILGIGTDIMDVARVREAIEKDPGFVYQIFTATEIDYCESKTIKYQHYTARFAAKEAFLKALGTGWQYGIRFTDIEIYHDQNGRPQISIKEKAKEFADNFRISKILVSLAHIKDFATAIVVIEGEAKD